MFYKIKQIVKRVYNIYNLSKIRKRVINAHHDVTKFDEKKVFDARKYGFNLAESNSYKLNDTNYGDYITTWESYQPRLNNSKYSLISDDKFLFSLVMENFVEVPSIYALILKGEVRALSKYGITNDTIYDFLIEHNGGVIKNRDGYDGYGVFVFSSIDDALYLNNEIYSREKFNSFIRALDNCVVQKRIIQNDFENKIYDKSINTIRMITIKRKDSDEHEIVAAVQRIGTSHSAPVDNFSQGGGSALIDLETGQLSAMTLLDSFDDKGERIFYEKHPDTNSQIKGLFIPNWDSIKQELINITRMLPVYNFVAWDIALTPKGIAVIETNMKSSLRVFQVHGGMRNKLLGQKYKEYGYIK